MECYHLPETYKQQSLKIPSREGNRFLFKSKNITVIYLPPSQYLRTNVRCLPLSHASVLANVKIATNPSLYFPKRHFLCEKNQSSHNRRSA